jgi:hypothetical protein
MRSGLWNRADGKIFFLGLDRLSREYSYQKNRLMKNSQLSVFFLNQFFVPGERRNPARFCAIRNAASRRALNFPRLVRLEIARIGY